VKKWRVLVTSLFLTLCLAAPLLAGSCARENTERLNVVTSTALISQVVERVGGDKVTVTNIIPPAQCPGHFDVKPGDIQKLAEADLFLMHNWQGEKFSADLIASADNVSLTVVSIEMAGNWMVPTVQRQAAQKITAALIARDPDNRAAYEKAMVEYGEKITAAETAARDKLGATDLTRISILCNDQQAGFLKWTGLNVAGTYGMSDSLTPQVVKDLEDQAHAAGVTLIVDNLQNGADTGKGLAADLGISKITLSNFPGGFADTETWEKNLENNITLLMNAIGS